MKGPVALPAKMKGCLNTRTELVFFIIVLVTMMQFSFHFLVVSNVQSADECNAGDSSTPRCAEAIIFRKWQALVPVDDMDQHLDQLLQVDVLDTSLTHTPISPSVLAGTGAAEALEENSKETSSAPVHVMEILRAVNDVSHVRLSTTTSADGLQTFDGADAVESMYVDSHDSKFEPTIQTGVSSTTTDLWVAYEDPSSWDNMTDFSRELVASQRRLEERMRSLRLVQRYMESTNSTNVSISTATSINPNVTMNTSDNSNLTAWASDLMALQDRLQARFEKRHDVAATISSHATAPGSSTTGSSTNLLDEIWAYGRELCMDPERRHRPSCAQFLAGENLSDVNNSVISGDRLSLATNKSNIHLVSSNLPAKPDDPLMQAGDDVELSFYERKHGLHWRDVLTWKAISSALRGSHGTGFAQVTKAHLRHAGWGGAIPKVACVAVIPQGRDAKFQMKYFLNGFKGQDYEGPKQLVMVYHHSDIAAKQLISQYTDGEFIKAVAAMGDIKDLSTTAYRYGAFIVDADIIARYDFGAWHHPSRLAMQVRSLALAQRPASRLSEWTARDYAKGGFGQSPSLAQMHGLGEASLVGERTWMSKNWYPLLEGESNTLIASNMQVVEVEMPELLVYSTEA